MGSYRARDLVRVPGLLSLARLPLGAAFPFVVDRPALALGVLAVAGLTDIADGWYARRFGQVTPTGAAIDPVTDKLFVAMVVGTLIVHGNLPVAAIPALAAREIGELPLVLWVALSRRARRARAAHPTANVPGKVATALQFAAVTVAILHSPQTLFVLGLCGAAGMLSALSYWQRELELLRKVAP